MSRIRKNLGMSLLVGSMIICSGCATSSRSEYELHATATLPAQESLTQELARAFPGQLRSPASIMVATSTPERISHSFTEMMQQELLNDQIAMRQSR